MRDCHDLSTCTISVQHNTIDVWYVFLCIVLILYMVQYCQPYHPRLDLSLRRRRSWLDRWSDGMIDR